MRSRLENLKPAGGSSVWIWRLGCQMLLVSKGGAMGASKVVDDM
ncbi:unnamed protein product [Acidithrix sp. C25]|nr:unnamed protein product [Acidithrix sp. C25]